METIETQPTEINLENFQSDPFESGAPEYFRMENDLGLALPYRSRSISSAKLATSVVRTVAEDGSYYFIEMSFKTDTEMGVMGASDHDVLLALITMSIEQTQEERSAYLEGFPEFKDQYVLFFNLSDVCQRLGLDPRTATTRVRKVISDLAERTVYEKRFAYSTKNKTIIDDSDKYSILTSFGHYRKGFSDKGLDDYRSIFYVVFHNKIAKRIVEQLSTQMNRDSYLSFKGGVERRIYLFLCAKNRIFGKKFVVFLKEIASVIGVEHKPISRQKFDIESAIKRIVGQTNEFSFVFSKDKKTKQFAILFEYKNDQPRLLSDGVTHYDQSFYRELCDNYGEDSLLKIGFTEQDYSLLKIELEGRFFKATQKETYKIHKADIDPIDLAVDVALFQIIKSGYVAQKGTRVFIKYIHECLSNGTIQFPADYRDFVVKRNHQIRMDIEAKRISAEVSRRELEKAKEEERVKKGFEIFWEDINNKNPQFITKITKLAEDELIKEDVLFENTIPAIKKMMVETKAKEMTREHYVNGTYHKFVDETIKAYGKMSKEEAKQRLNDLTDGAPLLIN